jgi:hypothetical protein
MLREEIADYRRVYGCRERGGARERDLQRRVGLDDDAGEGEVLLRGHDDAVLERRAEIGAVVRVDFWAAPMTPV